MKLKESNPLLHDDEEQKEKDSNPFEALNPTTIKISNPHETIGSLRKYETESGKAQKFLEYVDKNFRWSTTVFFYFADESALMKQRSTLSSSLTISIK
ncbi:hypothetical protein RCL_jg6550.t1 [Rhizophagus clarus]|uniref:Uncharacterized protein n=1 Tax=Rhizophagus clarus TaxID=94130 RepID=A0A8H3QN44_9GLOM|nr:hypothetical protein RCL_jg6550.t1 [Rhizophagus clarus]